MTPIDDFHTVLEGAIIRGIRAEEGAYEKSVGLAKSETLTRLSVLKDTNDFDVHFHIASLFRFKANGAKPRPSGGRGWGGPSSATQPSGLVGAKEIILRIDISYGGFDVDEV